MTKSPIPGLLYELKRGVADTNEAGFRGPLSNTTKDTLRLIALGDSVTHGYTVPYRASWPYLVQQNMETKGYEVEVINEGVIGYNTEQEFIHFKHFGLLYDPDIVVLAFVLNDFEEKILADTDNDDLVIQLIPKERHLIRYTLLPESLDLWLFNVSHFYRFANNRLGTFLHQHKTYSIGKTKSVAALKVLHALLAERDIPLLVVIIPVTGYDSVDDYPGRCLDIHKEMGSFLTTAGITFEDFFFMVKEYDMTILRIDKYVHFNKLGNVVIARHVLQNLEKYYPMKLEKAKKGPST